MFMPRFVGTRAPRVGRASLTLVLFLFLLTVLPSLSDRLIQGNLQAALLDLATQQPERQVSIIVQKTTHDWTAEQAVAELGGQVTKDLHIINGFAAQIQAQQLPRLAGTRGIRWVSFDAPVQSSNAKGSRGDTDCPECVSTANLKSNYDSAIGADKVWNEGPAYYQGQGIGVAVIDSSVNYLSEFDVSSKDHRSRILATVQVNKKNNTFLDKYGHGTHIAGIIGGNGDTSDGTYIGVAPKVNLINVKVSNDEGVSTASDVVKGLQWIDDNRTNYNIRVVNISLNSSVESSYNVDPIDAAAEIVWAHGIVVVAAGGNKGSGGLYAPANDPFVITVGAADDKGTPGLDDDVVASFSAHGKTLDGFAKPDLVAPGVNIVSDLAKKNSVLAREHPGNIVDKAFFRMSGTSMAAPMVAGAAALLIQSDPTLTPDQVKARLKATAVKDTGRWAAYDPEKAGAGYLDIYAAIHSDLKANANSGLVASQLLWVGGTPLVSGSVNWSTVNWSTVNWSTVNWSTVNWSSDYWGPVQ